MNGRKVMVTGVTRVKGEHREPDLAVTLTLTPTLPVLRHSVHSPYVSLTSCLRPCKEGRKTKNEERGPDDKDERHEG